MRRVLLLAGSVALALSACGDGATAPPEPGTFEALVSGEFSVDLEGTAFFGIYPGEGLGLTLQPREQGHFLGIGSRTEARPAVGTYSLVDPGVQGAHYAVYIVQSGQNLASFTSVSGELVITESTSNRLAGSFEVVARGYMTGDPVNEREVRIEGVFSAPCAPDARCD